jgi:lipopolysaccharide biosynthesis glycosyltransferase
MVVTTTVDKNYIEYLFCLVKSLRVNSPSTKVHCRLVNITDDNIILNLKKIIPNIIIELDFSNLTTKRKNLRASGELLFGPSVSDCLAKKYKKGKPRFLSSDLQCYTSNTRFRNIKKLLQEGYQDIIYLDSDTIVRKNIEELQPYLSKSDICCTVSYCERYFNKKCWECSFLYVKNNTITREFIDEVIVQAESDMFNWDSDQIALEKVYDSKFSEVLELNDNIKHIEDLSALHGGQLSNESFIWPGSGSTKFTDPNFLKEMEIYENMLFN